MENLNEATVDAREPTGRESALIVAVQNVDESVLIVVDERGAPADGCIAWRNVLQRRIPETGRYVLKYIAPPFK